MYANEITSLIRLSKTEHQAVANLATAVLSLIAKLDDKAAPPAPVPATREMPAKLQGAALILARLERNARAHA